MHYISTRGKIEPLSFREAVMMGLGRDGGLLLPDTLPRVDRTVLNSWRNLSYQYLAQDILARFMDDIARPDLEVLVEESYSTFSHPQVTPVRQVGPLYVLELFHGPTLAFKDIALQFLGNLFTRILQDTGDFMNILGATSGDTGSAAIHGVRGKENIAIFILHPHGRTSPIQALQMTTVTDSNVCNIAINGTFDDCQGVVKTIFGDLEFKDRHRLGAINSINWARILAQVVYYVYAYCRIWKTGPESVDFSVPTGNFGDIFAGFVARRLLPEGCIRRLILATNANDILSRFVRIGDYAIQGEVTPTSSPSMDIQVASNFERYLYYLRDEDPQQVRADMETFARTGRLDLSDELSRIQRDFSARSVSEEETLATIGQVRAEEGYLLDPHTAVGYRAGLELAEDGVPVVCLATAHPAKFAEAVRTATGEEVELPPALADLAGKESRLVRMDPDPDQVKSLIREKGLH